MEKAKVIDLLNNIVIFLNAQYFVLSELENIVGNSQILVMIKCYKI